MLPSFYKNTAFFFIPSYGNNYNLFYNDTLDKRTRVVVITKFYYIHLLAVFFRNYLNILKGIGSSLIKRDAEIAKPFAQLDLWFLA